MAAQPPSIVAGLTGALDEAMAELPDDSARYEALSLYRRKWERKYDLFVQAAARPGPMPAEFRFGAFGTIKAWDFQQFFAAIDERKTRLERVRETA